MSMHSELNQVKFHSNRIVVSAPSPFPRCIRRFITTHLVSSRFSFEDLVGLRFVSYARRVTDYLIRTCSLDLSRFFQQVRTCQVVLFSERMTQITVTIPKYQQV